MPNYLNRYDIWNRTTLKKVAFDVSANVALHWLNKLAIERGRGYVSGNLAMMWWPKGYLGMRYTGGELLDLLDSAALYGMPGNAEMEDAA